MLLSGLLKTIQTMEANAEQQVPAWAERFWSKVLKVEGGCWEWQAGKFTTGYGQFGLDKKQRTAHRVSYELANGPIPDGLLVRHACDNPGCVNPAHLLLGTHKDNTWDMILRGRSTLRPNPGRRPRKTHCKRGHELVYENLRVKNGVRVRGCKLCANMVNKSHYQPVQVDKRRIIKAHCKRGHELAGNNLVKGASNRTCRICANMKSRERQLRD